MADQPPSPTASHEVSRTPVVADVESTLCAAGLLRSAARARHWPCCFEVMTFIRAESDQDLPVVSCGSCDGHCGNSFLVYVLFPASSLILSPLQARSSADISRLHEPGLHLIGQQLDNGRVGAARESIRQKSNESDQDVHPRQGGLA